MPKSSIDTCTPISLISRSVSAARSGFSIIMLSVISSSSRCAGSSVCASACAISITRRSSLNWRGDRLTATRIGAGAVGLPRERLRARGVQHPAPDVADEAGILGERDEQVGQQQAALGMLPAHQRFDAGHGAGAHRHLRLVEQPQLVGVERAPDARAHDDALLGRAAVDLGEEREAVAP